MGCGDSQKGGETVYLASCQSPKNVEDNIDPTEPPVPQCPESRGDAEQFEARFRAHFSQVRSFLFRCGCPLISLDDQVQEVFLRAWQMRASFRGDAQFSTYLLAIARNVLREFRRRNSRQQMQPLNEDPAIAAEVNSTDQAEFLQQLQNHLSAEQWQAVDLICIRDVPPIKAAQQAGCEPSVFYNRLSRARKKIAKLLRGLQDR